MAHGKPGRPSKGNRDPLYVLMPVHLLEALRSRAKSQGMTVTDLVGETLAHELDVSYMEQEALPTSKAS